MMRLFVLTDKVTGKTAAEMTSREACEREAAWLGGRENFVMRQVMRAPSRGFRLGHPNRYVRPWPETKTKEFHKRYLAGEPISRLAEYFDTSEFRVTSLARKLGIPRRISKKKEA